MSLTGIAKVLLQGGARVNMKDSAGDTPLHYASTCGSSDIVQLLLSAGADPISIGADRETPLGCADTRGDRAIISLIEGVIRKKDPSTDMAALRRQLLKQQKQSGPDMRGEGGAYSAFTGAQQNKSGPVPGYDLASDVFIQGTLQVKAAGGTFKWRHKYFVVSKRYDAVFYWTGTSTSATSVAKMIRASTFRRITHYVTKKGGRRFSVGVTSGQTLDLLASSPEAAEKWLIALDDLSKKHIAATSIACAYKSSRDRHKVRSMLSARQEAVTGLIQATGAAATRAKAKGDAPSGEPGRASRAVSVVRPTATGTGSLRRGSMIRNSAMGGLKTSNGGALSADADGVVVEGFLKKHAEQVGAGTAGVTKLETAAKAFLGGGSLSRLKFRLRYFVLNMLQGEVQYFSSKEEKLKYSAGAGGAAPKARIPVTHLHSVRVPKDTAAVTGASSKRFVIVTSRGAMFQCEAPNPTEAKRWVDGLRAIVAAARAGEKAGRAAEGGPKGGAAAAGAPLFPPRATGNGEFSLPALTEEDEEEPDLDELEDVEEEYAADSDDDLEQAEDGGWLDVDECTIVDAWGRWWLRCEDDADVWWTNQYTEEAAWDEPENALGSGEYPWRAVVDDDGDEFYVNGAVEWAHETAEEAGTEVDDETAEFIREVPSSLWEPPPGWEEHTQLLRQEAITAAWEGRYEWFYSEPDEDGDQFFNNILTGDTQWEEPLGWAEHLAYQEEHGEGTGLVEAPEEEEGWEEEEAGEALEAYEEEEEEVYTEEEEAETEYAEEEEFAEEDEGGYAEEEGGYAEEEGGGYAEEGGEAVDEEGYYDENGEYVYYE